MEKFGCEFNWQRQFFVTDHVKHKNGFTLYKITSVVFPKKNPEASTKIVVWKRYNEFKKLYGELKRRHASLHIGEDFPFLLKSSFFSRFSEEVIKERKNFISQFLNFIAKCPSLFTADIFVKFFQKGYYLSEYDNKKENNDEISLENEDVNEVNSPLRSYKLSVMGQVLNSEGSQSSDESQGAGSRKKPRHRSNNSAYKVRQNYSHKESTNIVPFNINIDENGRLPFISTLNQRGMPEYWEEAVAHANEAHQQEILGNYEVAFAMYKTAIVCLLSGVQGDSDIDHRMKVKELSSQYLLQAEWIYNNYLVFQNELTTPKMSRIPWRSRTQLKRYKVVRILSNNLLVHDVTDNVFVVIKGVLKSSCPLDRSEICVLPRDVPHMVRLLALHETETTVFFVQEHIKYGKLWDHLEHYFMSGDTVENLETDVTCVSPPVKEDFHDSDQNSLASSASSTNEQNLSRLESSIYTDTMSCESLSSHEENYFDLIEDYARAKSQKLKEIQDFNERRKHVESLRPVKKTVSQVDLKSMDDNYEQHRSQSLTDLAHEKEDDFDNGQQNCEIVRQASLSDDYHFLSDEEKENEDFSSVDMDTQQLLRNAQKLIESINETLSKSENTPDQLVGDGKDQKKITEDSTSVVSNEYEKKVKACDTNSTFFENESPEVPDVVCDSVCEDFRNEYLSNDLDIDLRMKELNLYSLSPISDSAPSITEEYSITAALQRNGVTNEIVKKWAAEILTAVDVLHRNGVICRDLNPNNILLAENGSIKLTYFFRYPNVDPGLDFLAKERLYVAPELDNINSNVTFASDWWSFGVILYELITLQSLYQAHPKGIDSHTVIEFPEKMSVEAKSILQELLRYDPNERLGSGISGADDIRSHPYFTDVKWEDI